VSEDVKQLQNIIKTLLYI